MIPPFDPASSAVSIIVRPRNRHTYISITKEGEVRVRTPIKDEKQVRRLLAMRQEWIESRLELLRNKTGESHILGESIVFRGELYRIGQIPKLATVMENTKSEEELQKHYHRFYREEAVLTLPSRIDHYVRKMGLSPSAIVYRRMRRRWGSCDSRGKVTFNVMMMQLSYEHIDYIIVHELAHLQHMNHSAAFHALVRRYLPDERERRRQLRRITPL